MIQVIKPGFFTTVQDRGRFGFQGYGVIVSGVMDDIAFRIGNALLGQTNAPALEMTLIGGTFLFTKPTTIALTGGDMDAKLNGAAVRMNETIPVAAGDTLKCGAITGGARSYLHVKGGIAVEVVMNSRSTYVKAGIGGFNGRALQAGDELPYKEGGAYVKPYRVQTEDFYEERPIRILQGPEWGRFDAAVQEVFLHNAYDISLDADRMGYRLVPQQPVTIAEPFSLISEAVTFGTIQMPPNGEPIILMADRQTTGGYPKIGQVIQADLHRLAQMKPKTRIAFELVTMAQAEQAYEKLAEQLRLLELTI